MKKLLMFAVAALFIGACGDSDLDVDGVVDAVEEVVETDDTEAEDTAQATPTEAPAPTTSEAPEPTEAPTTTGAPATTEAEAEVPEPSAYPVTADSSVEDIAMLQQALIDAGYDLPDSGADGQWGAETAAAVATAALEAGLDPSAGVTAELWAALS